MNCIYCNFIMKDTGDATLDCDNCPHQPRFFISGIVPNDIHIEYTQFRLNNYTIELNHEDNTTKLFITKKFNWSNHPLPLQIISLNHIPKINPTNAKHWLDKLLNLKAFS
jgi:hypothetical protein